MFRLISIFLLSAIALKSQTNQGIRIGSTPVQGGTNGRCLNVTNGRVNQQVCSSASGVTSIIAGTGISVNAATGAVTVTNTSPGASPAGSAVTDAQCWASATTLGVCANINSNLTGTVTGHSSLDLAVSTLAALSTGMLKVTTGTGALSIAAGSDLPGGPYLPLVGATLAAPLALVVGNANVLSISGSSTSLITGLTLSNGNANGAMGISLTGSGRAVDIATIGTTACGYTGCLASALLVGTEDNHPIEWGVNAAIKAVLKSNGELYVGSTPSNTPFGSGVLINSDGPSVSYANFTRGSAFTNGAGTGCSPGTPTGGATNGQVQIGAGGACTYIAQFAISSPSSKWNCQAADITTALTGLPIGVEFTNTSSTASTASFQIPLGALANDFITINCSSGGY